MNALMKLIVICSLAFGLTLPVLADDEGSAVKTEKSAATVEDAPTVKIEKKEAAKEKETVKENPVTPAPAEKAKDGSKKKYGDDFVRTVRKTITGQVSGVSKDYIGVIYQATKDSEEEMGLVIEGVPVFERITALSEIQMGDTVSVDYDEVAEKDDNAQEISRHVARKITFVKKAPPPPPETSVLTNGESDQQQ